MLVLLLMLVIASQITNNRGAAACYIIADAGPSE
jgi:hypothetical protein